MKFKKLLSAVTFILVISFMVPVQAGWHWKRCQTSNGYSYQRQFVQEPAQIETQTTVINNLVGIPVPVNYSQPIAAQGSTVYGYSAVSQQYGNVDMALLYNQAARLTDQAQQLAGQASTDFATLVQAEGQNRAEIARVIAQGQAARQALEAASGQGQAQALKTQQSFAFRVVQGSNGDMKVEQIQEDTNSGYSDPILPPQDKVEFDLSGAQKDSSADLAGVSQLLRTRCASCHNNSTAKGGLNLEAAITDNQQNTILTRVLTQDLDKRMPRNSDGTASQMLNHDELRLLLNAMGN